MAAPGIGNLDIVGRFAISMGIKIAIGSLLGFLSGLGTGGGSILILWLTLICNTTPAEARSINLLFFIPSAIIASLFRWKQHKLQIKKVMPAILAGSAMAAMLLFLSHNWDVTILQKLFGVLLIFTGIREICISAPSKN